MDNKNVIKEHSSRFSRIRDWLDFISKVVSILGFLSIIMAAITLIWNVHPQWIPWNNDLPGKANAGHVESQMQLAEHYYEVGEYDDAIYWYKIASSSSGEYQPIACNDLGFLYAKGYGLSNESGMEVYRYPKALRLFAEAYDAGQATTDNEILSIIEDNGTDPLRCFWDECYPSRGDYTDTMSAWEDVAKMKQTVTSREYITTELYKGPTFQDGNTYYTYSGVVAEPGDNGYLLRSYHKYYAVTYEPNTDPYDPQFISLSMLSNTKH